MNFPHPCRSPIPKSHWWVRTWHPSPTHHPILTSRLRYEILQQPGDLPDFIATALETCSLDRSVLSKDDSGIHLAALLFQGLPTEMTSTIEKKIKNICFILSIVLLTEILTATSASSAIQFSYVFLFYRIARVLSWFKERFRILSSTRYNSSLFSITSNVIATIQSITSQIFALLHRRLKSSASPTCPSLCLV